MLPEPGNDNIEKWLKKRIAGYSDLTLDQLRESPVLAPGLQHIAYQDMIFNTPSGKIEVYSREAVSRWGISPLPEYKGIFHSGEEQQFPLVFITPNTGSRIHSQFGNLNIIAQATGKQVIKIAPADAKARNIKSGNTIRVFNGTGELANQVEVSNRVPTGVVVLPNGIWFAEGGGGNQLIAPQETDIGYGAAFHDNRVEIERVD
jgi:anaerobic selenocysteine-containing dehydrogenase